MNKTRLEAFSDGVIAIIITIMVLELKVPHGENADALQPLLPVFPSCDWANLHLLFWLSLFPVTTGWMGENHFELLATALYGVVLLMAAIAYVILQGRIIASEGKDSLLRRAVGKDWKGKLSPVLYLIAIGVAFSSHWASKAIYVLVALMWLVPDQRIERALARTEA